MSLSRAFTTKRTKKVSDVDTSITLPQRSLTTKKSFHGSIRTKQISAPIELISTTNMLSYNAPDIYPRSRSSSSSTNSDGRSSLETAASSVGTPFTSPESSSVESSPTSSTPPQLNHLSCYFGQTVASDDEAPKIPARALSHTKKSAEIVARKRSISGMSPKNSISRISRSAITTARSSGNMFSAAGLDGSDHNPFGSELAQVSELAEEFSTTQEVLPLPIVDEEELDLVSRGYFKFRAEDYISELQGLFNSAFGDVPVPRVSPVWI